MLIYNDCLHRTTLGQLCAQWDSQSRPVGIEPGIEPGSVVTPLALICSAKGVTRISTLGIWQFERVKDAPTMAILFSIHLSDVSKCWSCILLYGEEEINNTHLADCGDRIQIGGTVERTQCLFNGRVRFTWPGAPVQWICCFRPFQVQNELYQYYICFPTMTKKQNVIQLLLLHIASIFWASVSLKQIFLHRKCTLIKQLTVCVSDFFPTTTEKRRV